MCLQYNIYILYGSIYTDILSSQNPPLSGFLELTLIQMSTQWTIRAPLIKVSWGYHFALPNYENSTVHFNKSKNVINIPSYLLSKKKKKKRICLCITLYSQSYFLYFLLLVRVIQYCRYILTSQNTWVTSQNLMHSLIFAITVTQY